MSTLPVVRIRRSAPNRPRRRAALLAAVASAGLLAFTLGVVAPAASSTAAGTGARPGVSSAISGLVSKLHHELNASGRYAIFRVNQIALRRLRVIPTTTTTTTTTTLPPHSPRPPNVIQYGDSKSACLYVGSSNWAATLRSAEAATRRIFVCLETFSDAGSTWEQWENPWITGPKYGFTGWVGDNATGRTLIVTQNLIPSSEVNTSDPLAWEGPCASGAFDGQAARLASNLVAAGLGYSVIRLGQEMNGPWEPDFMGTTTAEQSAWAACFASEVGAMRSVRGANFLFDWNVAACSENIPLAGYYPGDAAVDLIGIDVYDIGCPSLPTPSTTSFGALAAEPLGLNVVTAFAALHHKATSLPEWATQVPPKGAGDDGYYVAGIGQYVATNNVAFQSWYDSGDNGVLQLTASNPNSLAAYVAAFG